MLNGRAVLALRGSRQEREGEEEGEDAEGGEEGGEAVAAGADGGGGVGAGAERFVEELLEEASDLLGRGGVGAVAREAFADVGGRESREVLAEAVAQ